MTYYVCKDCPHNTTDHGQYAPRACLVCRCKSMVDGPEYVSKKRAGMQFVSKYQIKEGDEHAS